MAKNTDTFRMLKDPMVLETPKLRKAAIKFAKAWASWHNHDGIMLDDELIDASHGILEAIDLELGDNGEGETVLRKFKP